MANTKLQEVPENKQKTKAKQRETSGRRRNDVKNAVKNAAKDISMDASVEPF